VTLAAACTHIEDARAPNEIDPCVLAGCRAGDPAALRAFVVRYQGLVFAFLSRALGAGPHVDDVAQEVFVRACRALAQFDARGPARASTWLLTIASRLVIDERRRRRVHVLPLEGAVDAAASATPETERRRMEIGRAVARAAQELTDEQRDVFVLAEFHGLDMKEIGAVLSIPEATVKTRLHRARERLRALLRTVWEER
jgi:RNA polymerase sigma-70 factor (ECF subfamily)